MFDIAVAPELQAMGLLPGANDQNPIDAEARAFDPIELLEGQKVRFRQANVRIDLGGIAKGFAVDRAIHELKRGSCTQGVVNAGGDLRRFGPLPQPIHLRRRDGLVQVAELRCGALATSAPHASHAERLAQPLGSIFDPRARRAWNGSGAVMVAAPSCVIADALTKVAALAGPACGPLLARFGAQALWDADPAYLAAR